MLFKINTKYNLQGRNTIILYYVAMATLLAPAPFCPTYINNAVTNRAYVVQVQVNDSRRKWFLVLEKKVRVSSTASRSGGKHVEITTAYLVPFYALQDVLYWWRV